MKSVQPVIFAGIGLVVLTIAGMVSVYQAMFSLWMTAFPFADINFWRPHFYFRLVQTAIVGVAWAALVLWMIRKKRLRRRPTAKPCSDC
jgi:hypothetical protein